ncbi:MAG: GumC family protein [Synechococcus sp.]
MTRRWPLFGIALLLANGWVWAIAILYLLSEPTYSSGLTISLPPSSPRSDISVGDIGQAQLDTGNSFGLVTLDPRESYKLLSMSSPVLESVASQLDVPVATLEKRVDAILPPNTSLIQFEVKASSAEEARSGAEAFYRGFLDRVNQLRQEEIALRNQIAREFLAKKIEDLSRAEAELANFRAESGLVSLDQLDRIADTLEALRSQRAEIAARMASERRQQEQLSATLGLSPAEANRVFLLQGDRGFQANMAAFGEAQSALAELMATRGNSHPSVVAQRLESNSTRKALEQTIGQPVSDRALQLLSLPQDGTEREQLLSTLIAVDASARGLAAQLEELDGQITALIQRQADLNRKGEQLVELEQRAQTLRVVLSSTTGALAIRETDVTTTYPLVQLVIPPVLPEEPISPKKSYALVGAIFGSAFVTVALAIAFRQRRRLQSFMTNALQAELPPEDGQPLHPLEQSQLAQSPLDKSA